MCGRTACACEPEAVARACTYRSKRTGKPRQPRWVNGKKKGDVGRAAGRARYYPSFNVGPSTYMPVLISGDHPHCRTPAASTSSTAAAATAATTTTSSTGATESQPDVLASCRGERVLQTMRWGLVPSWHKGDPDKFGTMLNNSRLEGIQEKASFRNALKRGQRCVIVCEGFYEWKTSGKTKQPYFMTFSSSEAGVSDDDIAAAQEAAVALDAAEASQSEDGQSEDLRASGDVDRARFAERKPSRLLTMAGLFDVWHPPVGSEHEASGPIYTYSIVTVPASKPIDWLHHRMPAILDGDEAIEKWLNFSSVNLEQALGLIHPTSVLKWHPVTQSMGNIRYKNADSIDPIDLNAKKPVKATGLTSWLKVSPAKRKAEETKSEDEPSAKKPVEE
ncbi:abasic site processing protein HMCES-like [Sycon ciliatum]|uniref:abasic site processing protein HMCES-like n=1 Tax=Sycon ciliatum TaxID=27933 RepID=UPI0020ADCD12|eukprot:scpid73837/ scgid24540/ UPF0361 protein C3orf37 homolog